MKCPNCGAQMKVTVGTHRYEAGDGLNVVLNGVKKTRCPECGESGVVIPKISQLNKALAAAIATKPERLESGEIRFLRKYLGWSAKDFSARMGVTPETVSRWENDVRKMAPPAEKLLRLSAIELDPVEDYPIPDLVDRRGRAPIKVELREEWSVVA